MGEYVKKKKDMIFQSGDSLQQVVNVVNEAGAALNDKGRTIRESSIPEVLAGALGAGIGGVGSFAALYGLGTVGLSAAGITSGLAAAGSIVGAAWLQAYSFWRLLWPPSLRSASERHPISRTSSSSRRRNDSTRQL